MESLDVFDTALFRDVYQPRDIFSLIEEKVGNSFRKKRIEAEQKAASKNRFYGLKEIYKYLEFDPNIEIEMEYEHVYANPQILEMYNRNPKGYVFISDMYLPSATIKKMLEKCGYVNPTVFVSCEENCNKSSGVLFEKVQKRVGKILRHYGDSYRGDIEGCIKQGIKPMFSPALENIKLNLPAVRNPMLKKYAAEIENSDEPALVKMTKYFAPLIYYFTHWVLDKRREDQHVYFLSRDMFMPYLISKEIMGEKNIHYIYCSRKSLCPLILNGKDRNLIDKMHTIFGENVCAKKKKEGYKDCLNYVKNTGIKDRDIIVDIGYSGTTQRVFEQALGISLVGKYVQLGCVPKEFSEMDTRQYLNRMALIYVFLAEFIFTSPEDNIEGYQGDKVIFSRDNERRKEYAKEIVNTILDKDLYNRVMRMNLSLFDIEQMLIHIQTYPSYEMMQILNEPILTNRRTQESCINFNREGILQGKLMDYYNHSYARPLFKKMLEHDKELGGLVKLLPQ